jgi:hypothetical protein
MNRAGINRGVFASRTGDLIWYLNRSTSGVGIIGFGATGDQPVPNAFVP